MSVTVIITDDYAVLESAGKRFYYGYEETDDEGEWCFVADLNPLRAEPEKLRVPASRLGVRDREDCAENLLKGIGVLLGTGHLQATERPA